MHLVTLNADNNTDPQSLIRFQLLLGSQLKGLDYFFADIDVVYKRRIIKE